MRKVLLVLLLTSSVSAHAEPVFTETRWGQQELTLLNLKTVIPSMGDSAIPSPPAEGTDEYLSEISEVAALQADPDNGMRRVNARDAFEQPVGDLLLMRGLLPDPLAAPTLWSIADNLEKDISILTAREAFKHMRHAPHAVSEDIMEMAGHATLPAFPSMKYARIHAVTGLLQILDDTCSEDYELMLADTALDMKFSGQHRDSDIRSAKIISIMPLTFIRTSEAFRDQMIRAETELGIHVRTSGCPFSTPE